jgi:PleD family two-component response regulator
LLRSLVQLHGGAITAASGGPDTGSTFGVRPPIERLTQAPVNVAPESSATDGAGSGGGRVLIVDDNRDAADSPTLLPQIKGDGAHVAYQACDAVCEARSFEPDMLLIDLATPHVDGYSLQRSSRRCRRCMARPSSR